MKTYTGDELAEVLRLHKLWLQNDTAGVRANLQRAYLEGANLQGANLQRAYLEGANLQGAYLEGANLQGAYLQGANLQGAYLTGEKWEEYLQKVVPELLTAGGKTVAGIVASGAWDCHSWGNCPMAVAFGVDKAIDTPILLRPRVEQFVQLFDAKLIPCPKVTG